MIFYEITALGFVIFSQILNNTLDIFVASAVIGNFSPRVTKTDGPLHIHARFKVEYLSPHLAFFGRTSFAILIKTRLRYLRLVFIKILVQ